MKTARDKIIARVLRWAYAMIGMEYSRKYRYNWFKTGDGDCSAYVFAMWLAGLFPLLGIRHMTSMYEVYAEGFDLMFPASYDLIGKDGQWAPKGFHKTFDWHPGDIVFMNWDRGTSRANKITHVLCNYDDDTYIHTANTREDACLKDHSYGDGRIVAVIRLKEDVQEYALPETSQEVASTMVTRIMQAWLNYHGAVLCCDGDWGPLTAATLKAFKVANGLGSDVTTIDTATWNVLIDEEQAVTADTWKCDRILKKGKKGADVYNLELALEALGYDCGMTKSELISGIGIFGSMCNRALRDWQSQNPECGTSGKPDGKAGEKTITKLGGEWVG